MGFQGVPGHEFVGVVEQCGEAEWIEKTYSLEDGLAAFEHAARKGILKVLLEMK